MYRKTMREALEEARAYRDPVNEDRGFSSQQIKMAYGVLNDPRYKQGNYSGAVRAIEKIARGLSNHPDVANALRRANEELEEALEVKWDSNKQGWFDKQGRRRYLGKMATNKLMSKAIDKAKETGDFINPFKLQHGQKPEEVNTDTYADSKKKMLNKEEVVKEAFSKNDFAKLEATNDHTEAAVKLINMFGTKEEKFKMAAIKARHNMTGYITGPDSRERLAMVNKYYSRLK